MFLELTPGWWSGYPNKHDLATHFHSLSALRTTPHKYRDSGDAIHRALHPHHRYSLFIDNHGSPRAHRYVSFRQLSSQIPFANLVTAGTDEETTIKVSTKKDKLQKAKGTIKLKKPAPKHSEPGHWRDGSVADGM